MQHVVPPEAGMGSPRELPGAGEGEAQLEWSRGCRLAGAATPPSAGLLFGWGSVTHTHTRALNVLTLFSKR